MYYVTMIDNFMSGWGQASDLTNIYQVECDSLEQAEQIEESANNRGEMSRVKIHNDAPYYSADSYLVTEKHYSDLGGCWIAEGGQLQ